MTQTEALQMCLEYIETDAHERKYVRHAIKAALANEALERKAENAKELGLDYEPLEAKDEPVAFFDWYDNAHWGNEDFKEGCHRSWNAAIKYTTPPQRTWHGLTDEERSKIWGELPQTLNPERDACVFAETIEVYLKEKNT